VSGASPWAPPLVSTSGGGFETEWFLRRVGELFAGIAVGAVALCPHALESSVICADASALFACCRDCWATVPHVPLAERSCDLCGSGQAVGWLLSEGDGWPIALIAAVCDACETAGVLGVPRPTRQGG
jgi:hypothetical protein